MPGRKGHKKFGGRTKGTPNKKTQDLIERCEESGKDPFGVLLELLGVEHEPGMRFSAAKELCQYLYPKRKSVELTNAEGQGFKILVEDYTSQIEQKKTKS